MSFRDDEDAARARVEALEAEIAQARVRRDNARREIEAVARERERLATAAEKLHAVDRRPPPSGRKQFTKDQALTFYLVAFPLIVLLAVLLTMALVALTT